MLATAETMPMLEEVPVNHARIRQLREDAGLSIEAAASLGGLSWHGWHQVESGRRRDPSVSTLQKIARALGVGLDDLVADDEGLA
ncbi:MAG: helix-turn-helix transcriptional regulator [Planctomycetota bacterium]